MTKNWPVLERVFDSLFKSTYLNLGLLKKGSKKDPQKRVNFGVKNGSKMGQKMINLLTKISDHQFGRNFCQKWYLWSIYLHFWPPYLVPLIFESEKGSFFAIFHIFCCFFSKIVIFDTFWQVDKFIVAFIRQKWQKNIVFVIFWKTCFVVKK